MSSGEKMIDFDVAFQVVVEHARLLPIEVLPLDQLLGRALAEPATSRCDLPPFDNSAVDGFALAGSDLHEDMDGKSFLLTGESRAGSPDVLDVKPGECVRVFTGAPLPVGTGGVAMQETAMVEGGRVSFGEVVCSGDHIRYAGREARTGDTIVYRGVVTPAVLGALAAAGVTEAAVYSLPKVGLLITGDELVGGGTALKPGQIYESNGTALSAAILALGLPKPKLLRSLDQRPAVTEALKLLLNECDVIVTSGGVSVGDHDFVRPALSQLGVHEKFWRVAMKPGKPFFFGHSERCAVFGLPGNPVSALTTYSLFARPYLNLICGRGGTIPRVRLPLMEVLSKMPGRVEFVPCRIDEAGAHPMVSRASHRASCLAEADGFVVLERELEFAPVGALVEVMKLKWGWES